MWMLKRDLLNYKRAKPRDKMKYQFYIFLLIVNDYSTYSDILNYTIMCIDLKEKEQKMIYIYIYIHITIGRPRASGRADANLIYIST